jgi:5-dehydro-4-deoxyglucarate dehydratase
MAKLRDQLRGVFGFPITPFKPNDLSVDYDALAKNVSLMSEHPFCAMVAAGGTGELYSLSVDEAIEVVKVAKQNTKMPVVGGVGLNATIACAMARGMEKAGADALLVLPPSYINAPVNGLLDYYAEIGRSTGLPLSIYSRDWAIFSPDMVARLADKVPTLEIWKDGQGNARVYQRIMAKLGDRLAWVGGLGDDCLPTYLACGVQAFTSSISNTSPKLALELAELGGLTTGKPADFSRITPLMNRFVHPIYAVREHVKGYEVSVMKYAMDLTGGGITGGPVRPPLENVRAEHRATVEAIVADYQSAGY